ncbi:hypothetical protein [Hydrogenophaga sp. 2FB]|uniref:hypothetical protein n=1 Tax=Hydrogenophaga sp. 2FB TaxID=2502187 RepID=UPI0010F95A9D|nr:hypothetical protein [Hydrogenophaga sp. 2FB]
MDMKVTLLASLLLIGGCATQGTSTHHYSESVKRKIANETTVDGAYSAVWDVLVRDLAKSFYVINNIDKESRIINVSFTSTDADDYVDCGRTQRTFAEGERVERYDYAVASKSTFKVAAQRQEHPAFSNYAVIVREPILEGRANIYVAPVPGDVARTTISVNTRYILNIRVRGEGFAKHISGNIQSRGRLPEETSTYTFNTGGSSSKDAGNGVTVTCSSRGKLESEILGFVAMKRP